MPKPSLLEQAREFVKINSKNGGRACKTCTLPKGDREIVAALEEDGASSPVISKWLFSQGHEIKPGALKNHFNNHHSRE